MNKITKEKLIDILKNKATDCFIFNDDLVVDIKEKRMIIKDVENKNYYENIFNEKNIEKNAKKEYFQEIKLGIKIEEYRLCTPYWKKRLENKKFENIIIRLGYPKKGDKEKELNFPYRGYEIKIITHPHFGNDPVKVYAIKIEKDN